MDTTNKKCENCIWYGKATFVCFRPENEGMRVFHPDYECEYYENK